MHISQKPYADLTARDCAIAFGIPTSFDLYINARECQTSDLVCNLFPKWEKYCYDFVKPFEAVIPYLNRTGVEILEGATTNSFSSLFLHYKVVILFTHWKGQTVEFTDGMKQIEEVVDAIPVDFSGIIDLCVCHPVSLVRQIRSNRPYCLIRFQHNKARPAYWLYFYRLIFDLLANNYTNYLDAFEAAVNSLRAI